MREENKNLWRNCYEGSLHLDKTAFIFPIGGAGDRLQLLDQLTQEPLPAACLLFCGRSLFENLVRDVQAQEYWHYRSFGSHVRAPIVVMSSHEKRNDTYIEQMTREANWFKRPKESIRRIVQPLVPLIDLEGQWVTTAPLELAMKPGGHGIIWKLAQDSGIFHWLKKQQIEGAIVRQVNNPLAGLDTSLTGLSGYGLSHKKSFGFLSCPSRPGMSEGLNILSVTNGKAAISNIEYTQFSALKSQMPLLFKEGICPANTNVLFANINDIESALAKDPFPGLIVNAKSIISVEEGDTLVQKQAGRLESSMQNISESFACATDPHEAQRLSTDSLDTFLQLQRREKFFSVAKKAYVPGQNPAETPHAALYDWNTALRELLEKKCQFTLPPKQSLEQSIKEGPNLIFSFNPSLGPFWNVIAQKLSHGTIKKGSELELEIAELSCHNLSLDGSLRILAKTPTGNPFSEKVGRAKISNLKIINKGLKTNSVENVLSANIDREESCSIILTGFSEIDAHDVTIEGPFHLVVPDGQKAILREGPSKEPLVSFEAIQENSWHYDVNWPEDSPPVLSLTERE